MSARVAVVIPYFQREPGVLLRALRSVAAQSQLPDLVLIVDDESPLPAATELRALDEPIAARIAVTVQENAGPGAARNVALDQVPGDFEYVAFLDSDDEWMPQHLQTAVAALESGYDLFFADHYDVGVTEGWIERNWPEARELPQLPVGGDCRAVPGDLAQRILHSNPIGMSTGVYRFRAFADLRFPRDFPTAEVNIFWLQLALQGARAAFSTAVLAQLGRGVNIYRGNAKSSAASLGVLHNSVRFRAHAIESMQLTDTQIATARARIDVYSQRFAAELVPMLRRPRQIPLRTLARQLRLQPATAAHFIRALAARLMG